MCVPLRWQVLCVISAVFLTRLSYRAGDHRSCTLGICGIPSAVRPTARRPRDSPRRYRCVRGVAMSLGCRVVAVGGGRRGATPCPPLPNRSDSAPGHPGGPPARRGPGLQIGKIFWETGMQSGVRCRGVDIKSKFVTTAVEVLDEEASWLITRVELSCLRQRIGHSRSHACTLIF